MISPPVRINYLNNKDLLQEIHRSKVSYCSFLETKYACYDAIVSSPSEITEELIQQIKIKCAARSLIPQKGKVISKPILSPDDVHTEDIVWRVMTYDHIPLDPARSKNPKSEAERHRKTNFPPFKHFVLRNGSLIEVGRSHWIGGLQNGHFCQDHGSINRELAQMFMTLVDRYSQRSNWRGYCLNYETSALTQRGWLGPDDITENDMIMSYHEGQLKWSKIKSIYRGDFDGLMHNIKWRSMNQVVTPNHRLVTERGLIRAEYILDSDEVILMGNEVAGPSDEKYSDDFVELMGWIVTEGNYEFLNGNLRAIKLWQNEGTNADRIRNCLRRLDYKFHEAPRCGTNRVFAICRSASHKILEVLPSKNLNMAFLLSLSSRQRELLINTMVAGDGFIGKRGARHFDQKNKDVMHMFITLCSMQGHRVLCRKTDMKDYKKTGICTMYRTIVLNEKANRVRGKNLSFCGGKPTGRHITEDNKVLFPNEPTLPYKGKVWCPETEYGSFLAMHEGTTFLTGNTYVSEMKGQALLQLSLVGLQFDEGRSENPFAYFTVVTANAFTRVLNLEKRNQNIRDDILIMNGANPSITRQLDDQLQQKAKIAHEGGEDTIAVQEIKIPTTRRNRIADNAT
jgi:hypothetical protein